MITISLCMIVKDEEATLRTCLSSIVDLVDEIIIVDTGSNDSTLKIAQEYTNHLYSFNWIDNFAAARNYSFSKATMDYCMWMDADDLLLESEQARFKTLKAELSDDVDTIIMRYDISNTSHPCSSCCRERIVKRSKGFQWVDPVHEYLVFDGPYLNSDITITHRKIHSSYHRNLDIYEKYLQEGHDLSERNWYYYACELSLDGQDEKACIYYQKYCTTSGYLMCTYMNACLELSRIYQKQNDSKQELSALLHYFEHDAPCPEILCRIGYIYKRTCEYAIAKTYFDLATHIPKPTSSWGYCFSKYWDYIPYLECCICCYCEGDIDGAISYNDQAIQLFPSDATVLKHQKMLADVKAQLTNVAPKEKYG